MKYCANLSPILHLGLRQSLMNNKPTQILWFSGLPECFEVFLLSKRMSVIQQNRILKAIFLTKENICCPNVSVVIVSTEHLNAAAVTIVWFPFLENIRSYVKKNIEVCMMLSYWTVKEIVTESICNFRGSYFQTSLFLREPCQVLLP